MYYKNEYHTHYFFNNIINIKNFDPNYIKIDKKSYKNILIYYIRFVTIKDSKYVKSMLRYFNFEPSFKLQWCRVRYLIG